MTSSLRTSKAVDGLTLTKVDNQTVNVRIDPNYFSTSSHKISVQYIPTRLGYSGGYSKAQEVVTFRGLYPEDDVFPFIGSGGGGCDAGFGVLALAAVSLILLKKRS